MSKRQALKEQKQQSAQDIIARTHQQTGESQWASDARQSAKTRFEDMGAPHKRDEYWKYADPASLLPQKPFQLQDAQASAEPAFSCDCTKLVFVNGQFRKDLSDDFAQDNLDITLLSDAVQQDDHWAHDVLGTLEAQAHEKVDRPLLSLNTVSMQEGVLIKASGAVEKPVLLHNVTDNTDTDSVLFTRNLVVVEAGAEFTLLESGQRAHNTNTVCEVIVEKDATFHHISVPSAQSALTFAGLITDIAQDATFKSFTLAQNGDLTRNEAVMTLSGENASGHIAGGVLGRGSSKIDNTVFITHVAENCESRQVYKNVLDEAARGIFQGKIYVKQSAQKTDGYQISQSVILSDKAVFSAKPELEIYADDVKCSHGSTTGALDETAMFYLRSRGVTQEDAEALLIAAFVEDAILEIEDEALQEDVRQHVGVWMQARTRKD